MKGNWIKMYGKFGSVLRIETVINCPDCKHVYFTPLSCKQRCVCPSGRSLSGDAHFAITRMVSFDNMRCYVEALRRAASH